MAQDQLTADGACAALGIALQERDAWIKEADQVSFDGYRRDNQADDQQQRARFLVGRAVRMLKGKAPAAEVAAFIKTKLPRRPHDGINGMNGISGNTIPFSERTTGSKVIAVPSRRFSKNTGSACGARSR